MTVGELPFDLRLFFFIIQFKIIYNIVKIIIRVIKSMSFIILR